MGFAEISAQIAAISEGVEGIGQVYERLRLSQDERAFKAIFVTEAGVINTLMITRVRTPERWLTNLQFERVYEFKLVLVYGLVDADDTEAAFQALLELLAAAFRDKPTLNGTCETTAPEFGSLAGRAGLQIETVEPRMFSNKLCHFAECLLGAQTLESRS